MNRTLTLRPFASSINTITHLAAIALASITLATIAAPAARAQGSRKDDIVFGPAGHPVSGPTITVCGPTATGTPCSPLAAIYTDATLTVPAPNPFQGDGIGNYHFYAPAGRYQLQITGPGIHGVQTFPDVILPPDLGSTGGSAISAFSLALGGNLTVAGNATITGTLTSGGFNPGTLTPSALTVTGNEAVQGPRPRVDVTAFGAKGDGVTDDTAAIQAAINAACRAPSAGGGGSVFFPPPPLYYKVLQPQTPSTSPVFSTPSGFCSGLHLLGGAVGEASQLQQFNFAPMVAINVTAGASPNTAPVFALPGFTTIENLSILGSIQAVSLYDSVNVLFRNVCLAVNGSTGQTDNTPLKITNSIWVRYTGGCLMAKTSSTTPIILFTGETPISGEAPLDGLITIEDVNGAGGGMQYIQRVNQSGTAGNFVFRNITLEDASTDLFTFSALPGVSMGPIDSMTFDHVNTSDEPVGTTAVLAINAPTLNVSGVFMNHVFTGNSPAGGAVAVREISGRADNIFITNCNSCVTAVVDGSGDPLGSVTSQNSNGFDHTVNISDGGDRPRTDPYESLNNDTNGLPMRATSSGNRFASVGIDSANGMLFNDGASFGYSAQLYQTTPESLDVGFARALPPTNVTGTATTGGTLAPATYTYWVRTATGASSCNSSTESAPSIFSAGVVVGSPNNAVNLTWTLPSASAAAITGYCIFRNTTPTFNSSPRNVFVSGASTTSFTDTGFVGCCDSTPPINLMQSSHRFTPTSLGVNTTNPQSNLDVNGSAAVNSLNLMQKAERFAGSDAGAKLNACLTAAASTSSVCDARGMTGTLTGAAHISIPAGTVLLWGQGQLTITDSTTNDAVELMGDGASIYGYQESGLGTVSNPDTSGFISCATTGCTTVHKPSPATSKINYVHIVGMYLGATGANSKVVDLTSIGHSIIESNNLALGTGGTSFGIFGDTSTGGFDGTNTLIRHNSLNSTGDTCVSLAGVYNAVVIEQNVCTLAPAPSLGYVFKKDSSGNYPNNDEIYGNDCEASSAAFGQVCYDVVGALSITFGPNNRCEKVYNCLEFPSDGSANGIHVLDPYLSISNTAQLLPNEPSTATIAIDNNGHNWLPSMHYGMNDLGGDNLVGNSGFEGWQNSTTLYAWGGVSGTNINQAGSGIYLQETSAGANPGIDTYTQGTFNVRVGDGATAGLGVNSTCIQVDSTREYTLMFRVASASTSNNFRPGLRFYWDANCTEADRITTASSNARVLAPVNYDGTSNSTGNWQSTNASLTYNNGITCNCNVTGADWQVSTANAWTPTRNFGLVFRVPNAFSLSTTVTHSMRVMLLENTAAAGNFVYFDDVALSMGPVTPDIRNAPVRDSGGSAVYGSLAVSQHLNQGATGQFAGTVALVAGTATVTFPTPFASTPVCVANDQSAIATVKVTPSASALTLTQASGTDTINWLCIGNPN